MELIIGGAYQGKLTFAAEKYGFGQYDLFDLSNGFPEKTYGCFYHLEALTRKASFDGLNTDEIVKRLEPYIKNAVVVSREIGCGIVPMEPDERLYRETHGAVLRLLAKDAVKITRIFCGLPEALK